MKLARIHIDKYGPLSGLDLVLDPEMQCIYGPNESGKTLLIDALLKKSFGKRKKSKLLREIGRVKGDPKGWISVADGKKELIVGDGETLAAKLNIPAEELRDIFVIRNSDLQILDEKRCFGRITEMLLGLRTHDIVQIQDALRDRGRLTEKGLILQTAGNEKSPHRQRRMAEKLIQDIDKYHDDATKTGIVELESNVIRLERSRLEAYRDVTELKAARELARFRDIEGSLAQARKIILDGKLLTKDATNEIKVALNRFEEDRGRVGDLERKMHLFRKLMLIGSLGLCLSAFLVILMNAGLLGVLQSLLLLIFSLYVSYIWVRSSKSQSTIETRSSEMIRLGQRYDSSCSDLLSATSVLEQCIKNADEMDINLAEEVGSLKTNLGLRKADHSRILDAAEAEVKKLKNSVDLTIKRQYRDDDMSGAEDALKNTEAELKKVRNGITNHRNQLMNFERQSTKIRFEMYAGSPLGLSVDSLESLVKLRQKLEELVLQIDREASLCRQAFKVFDLLKGDEEEQVSELLSKGGRALEVFSRITDGDYVDVRYDRKSKKIRVTDRNGKGFVPEDLSRATKDQLYLSIRVALGEQLLKGRRGFFVMDDPFIAADSNRTSRQIEILRYLVENGWQIVFFTAKKDLADSLSKAFSKECITLEPLRRAAR